MCGLSALRLGWLSTCWRGGVVVGELPGTVVLVVVVDNAGIDTEGPVTVVVVDRATAAGACSEIKTEQIARTTAANPNAGLTTRTRPRDAGREHPHRDHQEFISAPECDPTCSEHCNGRGRYAASLSD
jgi:hypothetical protein